MVKSERGDRPLYWKIYDDMLKKILSNDWPVGALIPSEAELCSAYGVSRMTIRLSLQQLVEQGYLERKQGKGSFVTEGHEIQKLDRFYSLNFNGRGARSKVISLEKVPAEEKVAKNLQIESGSTIYLLERIRYVGNTIFAYENSYIPEFYGKNLTREGIEDIGLYKSIRKYTGCYPRTAVETIEAVAIREKEARYLNVSDTHPVMKIERIANEDKKIIEYCNSIVRGDKIKYKIELK